MIKMHKWLCHKIGLIIALAAIASGVHADPPGSIAGGKASVTLPCDNSRVLIIVSVLINGKGPFPFILDSGAERNTIDPSLVQTLGLKIQGGNHIQGFGSQKVGTLQTENTTVRIGTATLPEQKFLTLEVSKFQKILGTKVVGFLGQNIFTHFVVQVDYKQSQLTLTLPAQFVYRGSGVAVPLTFDKHHTPQIEGKIDGIEGVFTIDTGADYPLMLYAPFIEKNPFLSLLSQHASSSQTATNYGSGGEYKAQIVPSMLFQFGGYDIHLPVGLSQDQGGVSGAKNAAGNIGGGLLQYSTVILDYSRKQIIFEPQTDPVTGQISPQPVPEKQPASTK